ncbi:hypothetical protein WS73_20930 [Burkholderia savannae]|nr:hypothetical protein WS73_20930 [Burkholderia savannae]
MAAPQGAVSAVDPRPRGRGEPRGASATFMCHRGSGAACDSSEPAWPPHDAGRALDDELGRNRISPQSI